ncbi:MAG: ribosome maturation factor RimM [Muribaculaceae bacterium]|nr:ribosome maturation factor RimM [Muribaculaceae bacterium]
MIRNDEITPIGHFAKPHGVNGEINLIVSEPIDVEELSCIVLDIDGINVPFFFSSVRSRGSESYLVMIDGVTTEVAVSQFVNSQVFALKTDVDSLCDEDEEDDGFYAEDLVGYKVVTSDGRMSGTIDDVDDSTQNVLFIILTDDGHRVFVPVANEFIADIDTDNCVLTLDLPDGLVDLN